jgi:hypothetical protein
MMLQLGGLIGRVENEHSGSASLWKEQRSEVRMCIELMGVWFVFRD